MIFRHGADASQEARSDPAPDELSCGFGVRGFEINPWFGMLGPAGLPAAILRKLHGDVVAAIRSEDAKQRLASQGAEAIGSSPDEFAAVIKQELEQWSRIVNQIGLRGD